MLVEDMIDQIDAITSQVSGLEGYSLESLKRIAEAMHSASECLKVEMLGRIADGALPSEDVAVFLELGKDEEAA